jgi:hypothetical protein
MDGGLVAEAREAGVARMRRGGRVVVHARAAREALRAADTQGRRDAVRDDGRCSVRRATYGIPAPAASRDGQCSMQFWTCPHLP